VFIVWADNSPDDKRSASAANDISVLVMGGNYPSKGQSAQRRRRPLNKRSEGQEFVFSKQEFLIF
jgi:hypothetical protein